MSFSGWNRLQRVSYILTDGLPWIFSKNSVAYYSSGPKKIQGIIIGPPGSGKGTVSERIVKEFNLTHLSSGDLIRSHIVAQSQFGKKIKETVDAGGLVDITLLAPLIEVEVEKAKVSSRTGYLLDGYPRTVDQAMRLDKTFPSNAVIYLNVPFETIIDRIKDRMVHIASGRVYNMTFNPPKVKGKDDVTGEPLVQRDDDKPESVRNRLELYQKVADPVLQHYRAKNVLYEFAGTETNKIWPEVKAFLQKFTA